MAPWHLTHGASRGSRNWPLLPCCLIFGLMESPRPRALNQVPVPRAQYQCQGMGGGSGGPPGPTPGAQRAGGGYARSWD